jgi:two-component system, response regulator
MEDKMILLVEDNPDDEFLTVRALKKNNIGNRLVIVRDGAEALDFLFCMGDYASREPRDLPQLILLDIKLPKMDGLEVLRRVRADPRTSLLPIVVLTSSKEEQDLIESY